MSVVGSRKQQRAGTCLRLDRQNRSPAHLPLPRRPPLASPAALGPPKALTAPKSQASHPLAHFLAPLTHHKLD